MRHVIFSLNEYVMLCYVNKAYLGDITATNIYKSFTDNLLVCVQVYCSLAGVEF